MSGKPEVLFFAFLLYWYLNFYLKFHMLDLKQLFTKNNISFLKLYRCCTAALNLCSLSSVKLGILHVVVFPYSRFSPLRFGFRFQKYFFGKPVEINFLINLMYISRLHTPPYIYTRVFRLIIKQKTIYITHFGS